MIFNPQNIKEKKKEKSINNSSSLIKDTLPGIIKNIRLAKYVFYLKAKEEIILPPYKGSTLRGGFGVAFKRICCLNKKLRYCRDCSLRNSCVYSYIFETSPSPESEVLRGIDQIPRPFIIEPPEELKTSYKEGDIIKFSLILLGKSIEYFPYFVLTFKELGRMGIGKGRGGFELLKITNFRQEQVYSDASGKIALLDSYMDFSDTMEMFRIAERLVIKFFTPTRIKFQGKLTSRPEFHIIVRSLLHRVSPLLYFHCGVQMDMDYNRFISTSLQVKIKESDIRWVDWERYSARQDTRMKLGGFVGRVVYEGAMDEYLPLILLGQYTHIGKNCTFGLGRYEIVREDGER